MNESKLTKERIVQILQKYVLTDLEASEPEYIRNMLTDTCGCTMEEINELGFGFLFPEED